MQEQEQQNNPEFINNGQADANSTSESENVIRQDGRQSNVQINNNNDNFFRYANGVYIPTTTLNVSSSVNSWGDATVAATVSIPLGGRSRSAALASVNLDNHARQASICTGILKNGIVVNYEMAPELSFCQAYNSVGAKPPIAPPAVQRSDIDVLRQQMKEQIALIKQQQQTIQALQLRLIQIQHEAPVPARG